MTQSAWLRDIAQDLKIAISFCTRLPIVHSVPAEGGDFARAAWALPLAGALVGLIGGLVYVVAQKSGIPWLPAAALSVAAIFIVTGGLHEDGLADTADGLGGGTTPERKLEIMHDSLIGAYGAGALMFSILLRVAAIANLTSVSVMAALIAAHAAARATLPLFMWLMPRARADGLSAMAGDMSPTSACIAALLGAVVLALALGLGAGVQALLLLAVVMIGMGWLALHHVGGQTGDILGALEQAGEIAVLLVAASHHS